MNTEELFTVTRWCCLSGCCIECKAQGDKAKRKRVVQGDNLKEKMAKRYCDGWSAYEPMIRRQAE
jgi:hypothetical protein